MLSYYQIFFRVLFLADSVSFPANEFKKQPFQWVSFLSLLISARTSFFNLLLVIVAFEYSWNTGTGISGSFIPPIITYHLFLFWFVYYFSVILLSENYLSIYDENLNVFYLVFRTSSYGRGSKISPEKLNYRYGI